MVALPALLMPVILLGGIYSGVVTPTEAAAVAAAYAFLVAAMWYRNISDAGVTYDAGTQQRPLHGVDRDC